MVHTWPLASAPARLSRNDNADAVLNEWILAWAAHQAPRNPSRLFDANIFYPDAGTLAYSEYLFVPAALGAPLRAAGASPVLVYNLLLLAGFALTGSAGYLLVKRWTGDPLAGLVAGTVMAFNAHTLTRLPQLQAIHVEFLPLALLALDALNPLFLAACIVVQGLTSYYSLIITLVAVTVAWIARGDRRTIRPLLVSAAIAGVVLAPALIPYARVGQVRPLEEVAAYSASARDYMATPARIHFDAWSARFFGGTTALFPGAAALALAAIAIGTGVGFRDRHARVALAIGIAGVGLSFGPSMPGYAALYHVVVPLQGIRNAARFGYLAIVGTAILAGFGVARLGANASVRRRQAIAIAALIAVNIDAFAGPIEYVDAEMVSPLHARLLETDAVVAEVPVYPADRVFRNAPYLLHSTLHWRPMINGYSGITPESYVRNARDLAHFPDQHAIDTLRALGVTYVFVHDRALRDWTDDQTADAVPRTAALEFIERDGDVALYRIAKDAKGAIP